jgi:RNAse (barnase) inhibitor barstar
MKPEIIIDANEFRDLEGFAKHFSEVALRGRHRWNGNLDAFNDILRGGFGTPKDGFTLVWRHSAISKERLGYCETIKWLEDRVQDCHPTSVSSMQQRLAEARQGKGQTLFDMLVEIIRVHGPGGAEAEDQLDLKLE